jgi:antirestriction protein
MNEREQQPPKPELDEERAQPTIPWDPAEQVGDIYAVEIDEQGRVARAERLRERPQIWVGSLSDYNNGVLYGAWMDAARDAVDIHTDIQAMLAASPTAARYGDVAEEWGIFDHEGFGPLRVGEHESIDYVSKVAQGIGEHGLAYAAWADVMEAPDLLDGFEEAYLGHFDSVDAYVEQLVDDCGYNDTLDHVVPESLRPYVQINVAGMANDMQLGGDLHVVPAEPSGVWLFDAR